MLSAPLTRTSIVVRRTTGVHVPQPDVGRVSLTDAGVPACAAADPSSSAEDKSAATPRYRSASTRGGLSWTPSSSTDCSSAVVRWSRGSQAVVCREGPRSCRLTEAGVSLERRESCVALPDQSLEARAATSTSRGAPRRMRGMGQHRRHRHHESCSASCIARGTSSPLRIDRRRQPVHEAEPALPPAPDPRMPALQGRCQQARPPPASATATAKHPSASGVLHGERGHHGPSRLWTELRISGTTSCGLQGSVYVREFIITTGLETFVGVPAGANARRVTAVMQQRIRASPTAADQTSFASWTVSPEFLRVEQQAARGI
jgi:hypothetical protein